MSNAPSKPLEWYSPAWGRWLFALAAAVVGFLLPQEVPLEWYPLNNPGQDIHYIEITCASDKTGFFQIFYNLTTGINELNKIHVPISPTTQTFTYTFPLPDGPIMELRLDPPQKGGTLTIRQMRFIDRRGREVRRITRDMFIPQMQIAAIRPAPDGWSITSTPDANTPYTTIRMPAPIQAVGANGRNLQRCLLSTGYLAMMLWILLLAVLFTFWKPTSWRDFFIHVGFMAALATPFSFVGNRGLIRNSVHYARFTPPPASTERFLELDLAGDHPNQAQLFWDTGKGYSETESQRVSYEQVDGLQTLRFHLPPAKVQGLRFDPFDWEGRLAIRGIRVVGGDGFTRAVLPLDSLVAGQQVAALTQADETLLLQTTPGARDPITSFSTSAVTEINQTLATSPRPGQ